VVERPRVGNRCFTSLSLELMLRLDNMRPGRALRWKAEDHQLGWLGSGMWKTDTSKVVAPPVLVEDRWIGSREQVLNVLTAYRRYGPDKPSSLLSTDTSLSPLHLWLRLGETLDGDPQIGQPVCWGCSQEFLFLWSSYSVQHYHWLAKG
jgi:hypothetical protein